MDAHSSSLLLFFLVRPSRESAAVTKINAVQMHTCHNSQFISFFELVSFSTNLSLAPLSFRKQKKKNDNNKKKKRKKGAVEK